MAMLSLRKTAIITFALPSDSTDERLPLTREREYGVYLRVDGRDYPSQVFRSPRNDEEWRDFVRRLRDCNVNRDIETGYRGAVFIRSIGRDLYSSLAALSPQLRDFLSQSGVPRRLVIQTTRPELHTLPWGALYHTDGKLLATGDLSIVQSWKDFNEDPEAIAGRLNLLRQFGLDTQQSTQEALKSLPAIIEQDLGRDPDILHVEEHGDSVTSGIGKFGAREMAQKFKRAKIALLWSCYSAAGNSWGESPALCLHELGSSLVLSFQAELHNEDAKAIAISFYRDVFGAAASRDPETALVRVRCTKFEKEFEYANWASMTVFLRRPLDLSGLPLNGPRVPAIFWTEGPSAGWEQVATVVSRLQQGSYKEAVMPTAGLEPLPRAVFAGWNGTVIRLQGCSEPTADVVIEELNLSRKEAPTTHPADRLVWLFERVANYGAPLIIWTDVSRRQSDFLKVISPSKSITFLLLYRQDPPSEIFDLVDHNSLQEAQVSRASLSEDAGDESWSAAYFAFARDERPTEAYECLMRIRSGAERSLLSGNFVSRFGRRPDETRCEISDLERWQLEEEYYRSAMSQATSENNVRDMGRAELEYGYLLRAQGVFTAADSFYQAATEHLERTTLDHRDSRWHSALGRVLRDRADLLAESPDRLTEALGLLRRSLAIHSFHGRTLQLAYAHTTAARIAFTSGRYEQAVENAIDAANIFELCNVWRGWGDPVEILMSSLAITHEPSLVIAVADFAIEKVWKRSEGRLPVKNRDRLIARFTLKKAQALWVAGDSAGARSLLGSLAPVLDSESQKKAERLRNFLTI